MSEVRDLILKIMQPEATDFDKYWECIPNRANYSKQELAELMYKEISTSNNYAEELARALEPFANFACDGETDPNHCHNCAARHAFTNYEESLK